MWERLEVEEMPAVEESVLLVALSTMAPQYEPLYSHARELSRFLLRKMEFKRFATLYSSSLPADVCHRRRRPRAAPLEPLLFVRREDGG